MSTVEELQQEFGRFRDDFDVLRQQIHRVMVGREETTDGLLCALLAGGHVLLEGAPGAGKTLLAKTLAQAVDCQFRRLQFTPDLMPADVTGTYVVMESHGRRSFEFQQGPIFANLVLADEINRATPKTQAALLESMAERAVTVANETYPLPEPFFLVATQSSDEGEGTFPLPAKLLDRFLFQLQMATPSAAEMDTMLERTTEAERPQVSAVIDGARVSEMAQLARQVTIAPEVRQYAVQLTMASCPDHDAAPPLVRKYLRHGAGLRGAEAMVLGAKVYALCDQRVHVAKEDLKKSAPPALRHRLALNFDGHADAVDRDRILAEVIGSARE